MDEAQKIGSALAGAVERLIGSAELKPRLRAHVWRSQIEEVTGLARFAALNALMVAGIVTGLSLGSPRFAIIATACTGIVVIHILGWLALKRLDMSPDADTDPQTAALQTIPVAFVLGLLWAVAHSNAPLADPAYGGVIWFAVAAGAIATVACLASLPATALAFALPLIVGFLFADIQHASPGAVMLHVVVGFTTLLALGAMALGYLRTAVRQRADAFEVTLKSETISLLMKEDEPGSTDWSWVTDATGHVEHLSAGFDRATGMAPSELIGGTFRTFLLGICGPGDAAAGEIAVCLENRTAFSDIDIEVEAGGKDCWWRLSGAPTADQEGSFLGFVGTVSNISQRKLAELRLTALAHNDPLTGLLNRTKFSEQLKASVGRLERYGTQFALMYLDLDNFKLINDSRGHLVGDKLLIQVSERIRARVRENDIVARLGGDEFAILLANETIPAQVATLAERLIEAIKEPFVIDEEMIAVGLSIGIAIAPMNGTRPDQLLRNADLALYRAKAEGKNAFRFFESRMDADARERRLLEMELQDAIKENQLVLHFQPVVSAETQLTTGFEALVRWNHPIRGLVPPAEFIPIAERSSLIRDIGDWTIVEACRVAATWPDDLSVAVNMSAMHFKLTNMTEVVTEALSRSKLAPHRLELEITEGLLIENAEVVSRKLGELRALGITIVMDDFGTGYSSLSYLLTFPFDRIKIDQSFVAASTKEAAARDILRAVTSLGKSLNLSITAEGVETKAQAKFLSEIACNNLQGFYFARPLEANQVAGYLLRQVSERRYDVDEQDELKTAAAGR